jgi:hypothetical protein
MVALVVYTIIKVNHVLFLYLFYSNLKQDGEDPSIVPRQANGQLDFNVTDSVPDGGFSF